MPGIKRRKFEVSKESVRRKAEGPRKIRAAIYARVSTEEQATEGFSLEAQVDKLRAYCASRDWSPVGPFVDEGFSATNINRPKYAEIFARPETWDVIVVVKLDRIHRNLRNMIAMVDLLRKREKDFVSITETLDTTSAMGRFVMDMIGRIAQLESETIGERSLVGMIQKAKGGSVVLGQRSPYGYRWKDPQGEILHHARDGSVLVVEHKEAVIVRRIFSWIKKGGSVQKIAKELGWCVCKPRPIHRTYALADGTIRKWISTGRSGDCVGCVRVRYIVNNPAYCGFLSFGQQLFPSGHEALIDRSVFEQYQARRKVNRILLPAGP